MTELHHADPNVVWPTEIGAIIAVIMMSDALEFTTVTGAMVAGVVTGA